MTRMERRAKNSYRWRGFGAEATFYHVPRERAGSGDPLVYFVQMGEGGPIKIGHTAHLNERMTALCTDSPVELLLLGTTPGTMARERKIHRQLHAHRMNGEWFAPHPCVLAAIEELLRS